MMVLEVFHEFECYFMDRRGPVQPTWASSRILKSLNYLMENNHKTFSQPKLVKMSAFLDSKQCVRHYRCRPANKFGFIKSCNCG